MLIVKVNISIYISLSTSKECHRPFNLRRAACTATLASSLRRFSCGCFSTQLHCHCVLSVILRGLACMAELERCSSIILYFRFSNVLLRDILTIYDCNKNLLHVPVCDRCTKSFQELHKAFNCFMFCLFASAILS